MRRALQPKQPANLDCFDRGGREKRAGEYERGRGGDEYPQRSETDRATSHDAIQCRKLEQTRSCHRRTLELVSISSGGGEINEDDNKKDDETEEVDGGSRGRDVSEVSDGGGNGKGERVGGKDGGKSENDGGDRDGCGQTASRSPNDEEYHQHYKRHHCLTANELFHVFLLLLFFIEINSR